MTIDVSCLYCFVCAYIARQMGGGELFKCPLDCPQYIDKRTKTEYITIANALNFAELAINWSKSGMTPYSILRYDHAAKYRERVGDIVDSVIMSQEWEE